MATYYFDIKLKPQGGSGQCHPAKVSSFPTVASLSWRQCIRRLGFIVAGIFLVPRVLMGATGDGLAERLAATPVPVSVLPGPIATGDLQPIPHRPAFFWWGLAAVLAPGLVWVILAGARAWVSDPYYARRRAKKNLLRLLASWKSRAAPPPRAELEFWRAWNVSAWGMSRAVPSPEEFSRHLPPNISGEDWMRVWAEAEHALYAKTFALPLDWPMRAILLAGELPRFPTAPWFPQRCRDWFPASARETALAFAIMAITFGFPLLSRAQAIADYQRANFAAAKSKWGEIVNRQPNDWAARHDLALALAQEEKWGEASGHWAAAFLLHPENPEVAAGLRLGLVKLDGGDPALQKIVSGRGFERVARLLSVPRWQEIGLVAGLILAGGLIALVVALYVRQRFFWRRVGFAAALVGAIFFGTAGFAVHEYGACADPRAAFITRATEIRTIPSDLTVKQQTSTLVAGTIAKVQRTFLTWDQIAVGPDVVGWVRADAVVWIYRHRDTSVPAEIERP